MSGQALLRVVIRTKARENTPVGALADYLCENLPGEGEQFRVSVAFRTRAGAVVLTGLQFGFPAEAYVKVEATHNRGSRGCRSRTLVMSAHAPDLHATVADLLRVFRS